MTPAERTGYNFTMRQNVHNATTPATVPAGDGGGFVCEFAATRTVFGRGKLAALPDEVSRLGGKRAMIAATPRAAARAREAIAALGARAVGVFGEVAMHVPAEVAARAAAARREWRADCCVAIGGGSAVGTGKAVALAEGIPLLAIPTTFSGSEMTPIWGTTEDGVKRTGRDERVRPRAVIYDPDLLDDFPASLAGPSGMNAVAHCAEALYAEDANPAVSALAAEGIRRLVGGLRGLGGPESSGGMSDSRSREEALCGAWLAGTALGAVGMALHHKLCHALGGGFGLPHAETHAIVLPHAAAYNRDAAPAAMATIAAALGEDDAPSGLFRLARAAGAPAGLKDIGMRESDLPRAADLALKNPYYNPAPLERGRVEQLLSDAFHGTPPAFGQGETQ